MRWPAGQLASVLGTGGVLLLPLVGAALSMWLGQVLRRREPLGTGVRAALGAGNALAVVLLLPMLAFYGSPAWDSSDVELSDPGSRDVRPVTERVTGHQRVRL